ncbi:hypothetical protein EDB89DRAFT_1910544 [Lactarius sanguifluus]|nr:hypothetical protein EDB89DRAFT_1910544 [Lactarius sanguifluus]
MPPYGNLGRVEHLRVTWSPSVCAPPQPAVLHKGGHKGVHTPRRCGRGGRGGARGEGGRHALVHLPSARMGKGEAGAAAKGGGRAGRRVPPFRVLGAVAEGGGAGAMCPRALPFCARARGYGKGGPRRWKREGPGGGAGIMRPSANKGQGAFPCGSPFACKLRRGRKGGPTVPAPVPPLRENRDGGSKDPFPFPRKQRRGRKGRPGPRLCILFSRNRGGRGGKRGRPREEAEGGQRGAVRCAATRGGVPPTRPIGHAERGVH